MKKFLFVSVIIASPFVIILLAIFAYLNFGSSSFAVSMKPKDIFHTESDLADNLSNRKNAPPSFATIPVNDEVAILYDTYGKDYWACYVRTSTGIRGWTECSW